MKYEVESAERVRGPRLRHGSAPSTAKRLKTKQIISAFDYKTMTTKQNRQLVYVSMRSDAWKGLKATLKSFFDRVFVTVRAIVVF